MVSLLEDHRDFVVIYKGAGASFHKEGDQPGIPSLVRGLLGGTPLFAVHRLDKLTSGLMVLAKSKASAAELSAAFAGGEVKKYYLALSDRPPKKKQGLVQGDLLRSRRGGWKLGRSRNNPSRTRFVSFSVGQGMRLYLLKPMTGKTHQLRVVMKSIGAPVLGDQRYYPTDTASTPVDRGYLHAYFLGFSFAGKNYRFRCLPQEGRLFTRQQCQSQIAKLGEPWLFFP